MVVPKYTITGGYGLIGSQIANSIQEPVRIISRSNDIHHRVTNPHIKEVIKDITNIEKKDIDGTKILYHCASTVDNYHVLDDPYTDIGTNAEGTIRLLEIIKEMKEKPKLIFLSTFFVYGNIYDMTKTPITESSPTDPLALYPASKLFAESAIKLYSKLYGIPYIISRLTNVYSKLEDYTNKKKGAFNYLIMNAVKGKPVHVYRGGNFYRDYIYLDDVVIALRFIENKLTNDTILIGYGTPVLFRDMIGHLLNITGNKSTVDEIEPPEFHSVVGIKNFVADCSKIKNLGWIPKIDYKTGISRIVNHYKGLHQ